MAQMYTISNGAITGGPYHCPPGVSQPPLVIPLYGPNDRAYPMHAPPAPVGSLISGPFPGGPTTGPAPFGGHGIPPFGGGPMLGPLPTMPQPGMGPIGPIGPSPFGGPGNNPFNGGPTVGPAPMMPGPGGFCGGPMTTPFNGGPTVGPAPMMPGPGGFCGGPMTTPYNGGVIPYSGPGSIPTTMPPPSMAISSPPTHQAAPSAPSPPAAAPGLHEGTDTIQSTGGHRLHWVEAGMQGHPIWRK